MKHNVTASLCFSFQFPCHCTNSFLQYIHWPLFCRTYLRSTAEVRFEHRTLTCKGVFLHSCISSFTSIKNLKTSSTAACCACSSSWIWRNPLSAGCQEQRAFREEEEGSGVHPSTPPSLCHPSLPSLPSPHMGFAFGWTLGFFHRGCRLPREIEPQKSWANVCGSLRVRRGLFILLFPPFFLLLFCSFVLFGSLARSFSPHEWKDNIDLCQSRLLFSWTSR